MSRPAYMLTPSLGNYNLKILNFKQKICLYIKFKSYFGQKITYYGFNYFKQVLFTVSILHLLSKMYSAYDLQYNFQF